MKKILIAFVLVGLLFSAPVKAQTNEEIQEQINTLLDIVAQLQAQLAVLMEERQEEIDRQESERVQAEEEARQEEEQKRTEEEKEQREKEERKESAARRAEENRINNAKDKCRNHREYDNRVRWDSANQVCVHPPAEEKPNRSFRGIFVPGVAEG